MGSLNHNKICELEDFRNPELVEIMRDVFRHELPRYSPQFPEGVEYRKYWEIAMSVRALRQFGVMCEDATILGVGAGTEVTLFYLANHVGRVIATDIYENSGEWTQSAPVFMLTEPWQVAPYPYRRERLDVCHMSALALDLADNSVDGIFSSGSIEHFGALAQIANAAYEMGRVLKPGGILTLSTEFQISGPPDSDGYDGLRLFRREHLLRYIVEASGCQLVDDLQTVCSPATLASAWEMAKYIQDKETQQPVEATPYPKVNEVTWSHYPHIVINWAPYQFTSVHLTLRKPIKQGMPNNQWANPRKLAGSTYQVSAHGSENSMTAPVPEFQNRVAGSSTTKYWTKRDGVNVLGDLGGDFGLAVAARKMVDLMLDRGIPISYVHKHFNPLSNTLGQKYAALAQNPTHRINLSNLNMRETKYLFDRAQWIAFTGAKYTIANWYWELPTPPKDLLEVFGWVDEIWVASHYVRESMARASTVPVHVIPPFIEVQAPAVPDRSKFGLAGGRHIMLYNFSALSGYSRKNPFAVIEAYRRAFGNSKANDAPLLLIKAQFLDQLPELAAAVQRAVDAVGGVLLTKDYSRTEYDELVACADSYVSLHRCEGFGFGLADAMCLGKPVIATNYSSNVDFMTEDNSFPVNFTLRPIQEDDFTFQPSLAKVYEVGQIWAEPDLDHAAALMTTVVNQPDLAAERGRRAASDIRGNYSAARIGAMMEQRLTQIDLGQTTIGEAFVASQRAQSGQDAVVVNGNSAASLGQSTLQTPVMSTMKASTLTQLQSRLKNWNMIRNNYMFYGFGNFINKLPVIGHMWRVFVRLLKLGRAQNAEYQMFQSMVEYLAQIPGEVQIIRYEMSRLETAGNASQQSIVEGMDRKVAAEFASLKEAVETLQALVSKVNRKLEQLEQIERTLTEHMDTASAHGTEEKIRELVSSIRLLEYQFRAQPLVGVAHGNDQFAEYEDALQVVRWLEKQDSTLAEKDVEVMFQDSRADRAVAAAAAYFGDRISVLTPSIIYYFNFLPEWDIAAFADRIEGRIPDNGYIILIVPKRGASPHAAFEQDYGTLKSQPTILASVNSGRAFFVHMWKKSTRGV